MLPMMRLEDAISTTSYIRSGGCAGMCVGRRGQKQGDEARLRHLKINAIHMDESQNPPSNLRTNKKH